MRKLRYGEAADPIMETIGDEPLSAKREVTERICSIDSDDFTGDISCLSDNLRAKAEVHNTVAKNGCYFKFSVDCEIGYWDNPDQFYLTGTRYETSEERTTRVNLASRAKQRLKEKKAKENAEKEARELKELERLEKKYREK